MTCFLLFLLLDHHWLSYLLYSTCFQWLCGIEKDSKGLLNHFSLSPPPKEGGSYSLCRHTVVDIWFWHLFWCFPPHTKQFSGTSRLSYSSNQFWHYILGNSIRCQSKFQIVTCASDQLVIDWRLQWHPHYFLLIC